MPKVPRDRSHRDVVRFLTRRGWTLAREGARHTILTKADAIVAVPRHERIKTGTLRAILDEAGLSVEEAVEDL